MTPAALLASTGILGALLAAAIVNPLAVLVVPLLVALIAAAPAWKARQEAIVAFERMDYRFDTLDAKVDGLAEWRAAHEARHAAERPGPWSVID